jgi:hypothetical protein
MDMKRLLLEHYEENGGRNLWEREWAAFKQKGDLFPAAAEILRENEKIPEDQWGITMNRQWVFAFNILYDMGLEGDPRVGPLFMPYIKRSFQPGLPEHPDMDQRWLETSVYMIKANDSEGCKYYQERLRGTDAIPKEKHWLLESIDNFGSPDWIPFLKTLKLSPADLASDMRLAISLKVAVEKLEKRAASEKRSRTQPVGPALPTGTRDAGPPRAPADPGSPEKAAPVSPPAHVAPAAATPFNEVLPAPGSARWHRMVIAGIAIAVLVIFAVAVLRRRARPR